MLVSTNTLLKEQLICYSFDICVINNDFTVSKDQHFVPSAKKQLTMTFLNWYF